MRKTVVAMLFAAVLLPVQAVRADMLTVNDALASSSRARIVQELQAAGVPADAARERVATLTDQEAAQLEREIATAPAGGNAYFLWVAILAFFAFIIYQTKARGY
jgi:flagellar biosynthesis/type III secretory pathway M-ring protein FliF/YscJ